MNDQSSPAERLVVLATFSRSTDAQCLRVALENAGIRAAVVNEQSTTLMGATWFGPTSAFWVEVLVFESDADRALLIKSNLFDDSIQTDIPEWTCSCGETVDSGFEICWACSTPYPGPE